MLMKMMLQVRIVSIIAAYIVTGLLQLCLVMAIPSYINCNSEPVMELATTHSDLQCTTVANTIRRYTCNETRYTVTPTLSTRKGYPYFEFVSMLKKHSSKILFAGDSLTEQMERSFACSLEEEYIRKGLQFREPISEFSFVRTCFLVEPPPPYHWELNPAVNNKNIKAINLTRAVLDNNVTHLVLNTGPWYEANRFKVKTESGWIKLRTVSEVLPLFRAVFSLNGSLMTSLKELHQNYGVTIIWRDSSPAGRCDLSRAYASHDVFPQFNQIAQDAIRAIGGHILSGIWEHALPLWRDHIDTLHWCLLRPNSVPSFWNERLMEFIYKQLKVQHHHQSHADVV